MTASLANYFLTRSSWIATSIKVNGSPPNATFYTKRFSKDLKPFFKLDKNPLNWLLSSLHDQMTLQKSWIFKCCGSDTQWWKHDFLLKVLIYAPFSGVKLWHTLKFCSIRYFSICLRSSSTRTSFSQLHVWKRDKVKSVRSSLAFMLLLTIYHFLACLLKVTHQEKKKNCKANLCTGKGKVVNCLFLVS